MAQDKDKKTLNVPPLRFPGFTDEWKRVKVSDLLDFYSTNSLSWDMLNYDGGEIKNLHYGLIHSGLPTLIDVNKDSLPFVNEASIPKKYTLCIEGDVAFADASEDTNEVGKVVEFLNTNGENIISGLHTIHGRDKSDMTVTGFKGYAFSSMPFHHQIRRIAQGTKIYSISTKTFDEVYIGVPTKDEQAKIARLLQLLDERIATQNKIIEDLKKLKSAIAHKLLNDTVFLETRISLGEVCELMNGYAFKSSSYARDGKYKILTIANVQGKRYILTNDCNTISYLPKDLQDHQMLRENDILISMTGNVGRVSLCQAGHYLLNQRVGLLVPKIKEVEFFYQVLASEHFEQSMIACGQGAAQMNIGKSDIYGYMMPFSHKSDNMNHIARVLQAYDNYIGTNIKWLDLLILQKQYLLSRMFI